jgi:Holliday junction resolvase RusA-like endonuclease
MLEFTIPVKPQGKARHRTRVVMIGKKPVAMQYSDRKAKAYEQAIRDSVIAQYKGDPLDGPLIVSICAWFKKPKSSRLAYPTVKPDADNIAKAVLDSLNGILWHDDKQVCQLTIHKVYADRDAIELEVMRMSEI